MSPRILVAIFFIIGLVVGLVVGVFTFRQTEITSSIVTETVTKSTTITKSTEETFSLISTRTLTETITNIKTITITELRKNVIVPHILAKPYLAKEGDRRILFNITVKVYDLEGSPARGAKVVLDNTIEKITDDLGVAEVSGVKAGVHRIRITWEDYTIDKSLELAFPDIDPNLYYVDSVSGNKEAKTTFVAAYYGWYGLEDLDWFHWDNPRNPTARYLPLLGQISDGPISQSYSLYGFSSNDESNLRLVKRQMALAKMAGITAFAVSWWGPGSFEDRFMPTIMKAAEQVGFKVTVIFEPFYKNAQDKWKAVDMAIDYLMERYMDSEVWLRDSDNQPVVFTFDIGPPGEWSNWKKILSGRNMAWVAHTTDRSVLNYGFKYFYEYSPVGIIAAGNDIMRVYMGVSDIPPYDRLFIPTVSPRYDDTKVRQPGYVIGDQLWESSVEATKAVLLHRKPQFVFVTSWNEWHESTSIEPDTSEGFRFLISFAKEFYGEDLSEEDFLRALRITDCLEFCTICLSDDQ